MRAAGFTWRINSRSGYKVCASSCILRACAQHAIIRVQPKHCALATPQSHMFGKWLCAACVNIGASRPVACAQTNAMGRGLHLTQWAITVHIFNEHHAKRHNDAGRSVVHQERSHWQWSPPDGCQATEPAPIHCNSRYCSCSTVLPLQSNKDFQITNRIYLVMARRGLWACTLPFPSLLADECSLHS